MNYRHYHLNRFSFSRLDVLLKEVGLMVAALLTLIGYVL